ncbi:zinc finger, C2H2 type [Ancylostoma duodenale]|uniref:Zinc finger, C2H2 type n=1 Tax=Ancylostoma duodenale TaxID=51022 RepID=A0A0C2GQZ9_9BILA|nr:zinc finger, C2H2 type [Ancylostoma duodenale]
MELGNDRHMTEKEELHAHNNSMMRTGHPGDAKAIAISSRPPGSLSQAELRGEEHASPRPPKSISRKKDDKTNAAQLLFSQLMNLLELFPGEFLCGHCGKTFCHAASLNRHRLNFHGDDQHCQLCDAKIPGTAWIEFTEKFPE